MAAIGGEGGDQQIVVRTRSEPVGQHAATVLGMSWMSTRVRRIAAWAIAR